MPSLAEIDRPAFRLVGDLTTVDGLLAFLGVTGADRQRQRQAILAALQQPTLRPFVIRLWPDLRTL